MEKTLVREIYKSIKWTLLRSFCIICLFNNFIRILTIWRQLVICICLPGWFVFQRVLRRFRVQNVFYLMLKLKLKQWVEKHHKHPTQRSHILLLINIRIHILRISTVSVSALRPRVLNEPLSFNSNNGSKNFLIFFNKCLCENIFFKSFMRHLAIKTVFVNSSLACTQTQRYACIFLTRAALVFPPAGNVYSG